MQQADATRIAALCDQQIERMLSGPGVVSHEHADIIFGLADLRNMYAGAPDVSEMTPQNASWYQHRDQTATPLYGDGTPGNIAQDIEREVLSAGLAGSITIVEPKPGETMRQAMDRTQREARGEEKFGFRVGDEVVLNFATRLPPRIGTVQGFLLNEVKVQWPHNVGDNSWNGVKPEYLTHYGP